MRTLALLVALGSTLAYAQNTAADQEKVIQLGKSQNQAYKHLKTFTGKFGPRLTSSPNLAKAQEWAVGQFKSWGLKNVQLEKWGEVPVGFYRGKNQVVRMTAPWNIEFQFTTPAWTPGTAGKQMVQPVLQPETMEEFEKMKATLPGKWVIMTRTSGLRGPQGEAGAVERALAEMPLAGRIYGTSDERVHTGGRFTGLTWDKLPTVPEVRIRKSDMKALVAAYRRGGPTLELNIENHFVKGPVPQYNVIADLPGSEKPDEMVIVCGHFDSWNGPGSVGANDNGTGSSVTLEAARLLAKSGVKPKRTIRFILWSGEEQGLLGSRAYVEKHKAELGKISAVFNDDGGTNYQGGYNILPEMKAMLEPAIAPTQRAFPNLPMTLPTSPAVPRGGSSDHAPFVWAGVPAFFTIESGRADYGYVWHTQNDKPENSIEEYLTQSSSNAASVALYVANAPELMGRLPVTQQTLQVLAPPVGAARHYFPFGEDHGHEKDGKNAHDHNDEYYEYMYDLLKRIGGSIK
ncbi:MAG: M20/M25/M40 family metallo-hydrolase [Chthonomonas sp.]|nr:M20/M25/M40 family metallo-hydrolase [Chthonomonas sp.]